MIARRADICKLPSWSKNMMQAICRLFTAELRVALSRLPTKQRETVLPPIEAEVPAPGRVEYGRSMMSSGWDASDTRLLPWRAVRLWLLLSTAVWMLIGSTVAAILNIV
jgi:hypothetical protein